MGLKVFGISGSPVKNGNVEAFLEHMMASVRSRAVQTGAVHLSGLRIEDCIHCNFCLSKQKPGRYCSIKDDAQAVFEQVMAADILVLCSPVYFMRTSARMAAFIDRLRVFVFGSLVRGALRNRVGVSAAVAWQRNGGLETTHLSHMGAFFTLEMIPVSIHTGVSPLGASALASQGGSGEFDPSVRFGIERDELGLASARALMERAVEVAGLLKKR